MSNPNTFGSEDLGRLKKSPWVCHYFSPRFLAMDLLDKPPAFSASTAPRQVRAASVAAVGTLRGGGFAAGRHDELRVRDDVWRDMTRS